MELARYQLQVFISLIVILGAAFVALICDLLKANNEQLRELAIEVRVRREEEYKRFQMLVPRTLAAAAGAASGVEVPAPQVAPPLAEQTNQKRTAMKLGPEEKKRERSPEALAAIRRAEQLAASPRLQHKSAPVPVERREAAAERATAVQERATQSDSIKHEVVTPEVVQPEALKKEVEVPVPAASLETAPTGGRSRDWNLLLSTRYAAPPPSKRSARKRSRKAQESPGLLDAVVAATNSGASAPAEPSLPAGFQEGFVLTRLAESRQPVTGLVVSIGANSIHGSGPRNQGASAPGNVRHLIQSLLGPNDFATQSGKDEFLLIYPGVRGAQAQRILGQIAEQLWDFQLRSMDALSILFSWGGVEVRSESIKDAIASATERMQETRRNRKVLTMEARPETEAALRQAV